jgi:hypothetical protein
MRAGAAREHRRLLATARSVLEPVEHGAKLEKRASEPRADRTSSHTLTLARLHERTVVLVRLKAKTLACLRVAEAFGYVDAVPGAVLDSMNRVVGTLVRVAA